jgi:hypothetical protein
VTIELTAENHWPTPTARTWAVGQRAYHARERAMPLRVSARLTGTGQPLSARPPGRDGNETATRTVQASLPAAGPSAPVSATALNADLL